MHHKPGPLFLRRKQLLEIFAAYVRRAARAGYIAAGLLLVATVLTLSLAGIKYKVWLPATNLEPQAPAVSQGAYSRAVLAGDSFRLVPEAKPTATPAKEAATPPEAPPSAPPVSKASSQPVTEPLNLALNTGQPPPAAPAAVTSAEQKQPPVNLTQKQDGPPLLPKGEIKLAFGWQLHPLFKDWRFHTGIDLALPAGQQVRAVQPGKVVDVYRDRQTGLTVAVEGLQATVYYGALDNVTVSKGETVAAGSVLGTVGMSPTEPYSHLHLAVRANNQYVDPQQFWPQLTSK